MIIWIAKQWGRFWRWWHCLCGMLTEHHQVDFRIDADVRAIGCSCGKIYWAKTWQDRLDYVICLDEYHRKQGEGLHYG